MGVEISLKNLHFLASRRGEWVGRVFKPIKSPPHMAGLFISSGTSVYLTIPLLYPTPSELLGQLLPCHEQLPLRTQLLAKSDQACTG